MLAGPGAITTAILMQSQAEGVAQHIALYACIVAVCVISYLILRMSAHGLRWISPLATKIAARLMGLLLAAVAMQFMLNALKAVLLSSR
jgi:multiple antibiotic resistance protein